MVPQSTCLLGAESGLKIADGTTNLKIGAKRRGRAPNPRQIRCSSRLRGTVLRA